MVPGIRNMIKNMHAYTRGNFEFRGQHIPYSQTRKKYISTYDDIPIVPPVKVN